ncbi:NYN domain-containing protein [Haliangium ochraceum]|uniref:NYN domain-containing protein n=1 Tax=Haliangium ochraceum (strain DSM 14365 / JCM 11303 / SMP-2) TaxID=502025 RepID=D0LM55_HALO1|nr:NYN domain-containing protein [Haliangium ochraceum]ACY16761.1 protein of unknown function DUF88 [Haliangium ochraceum DSM 14365]
MHRFSLFVDGSNLFGVLRGQGIQVDDYQGFYRFLFEQTVSSWHSSAPATEPLPACLVRVYWYVVGQMDDWDLSDSKTQRHLQEQFERDEEVQRLALAEIGHPPSALSDSSLCREAWKHHLSECRRWYDAKRHTLDKMRRFYHAVRSSTDFIDIDERGHWKVDILRRSVQEKGIDTSLAVDMVAMLDNYDVAVVLSGDADMIPSIEIAKNRCKQVAAVQFQQGQRTERRGRGFASRLKASADFVVTIYEDDLLAQPFAERGR